VLMTNAPEWGLRAGYRLTSHFGLEASWSHADTRLEAIDPPTGAPTGPTTPVAVDSVELDGLFGFGGPKVRGYVGLGGGAQRIRPNVPTLDSAGVTTRFAANIAIGVFYFFAPRLALRVDGRYRWRISNGRIGAVEGNGTFDCEPEPIGCKPFATDIYSTGELTGGLAVRF
jgi:hypothetical protein